MFTANTAIMNAAATTMLMNGNHGYCCGNSEEPKKSKKPKVGKGTRYFRYVWISLLLMVSVYNVHYWVDKWDAISYAYEERHMSFTVRDKISEGHEHKHHTSYHYYLIGKGEKGPKEIIGKYFSIPVDQSTYCVRDKGDYVAFDGLSLMELSPRPLDSSSLMNPLRILTIVFGGLAILCLFSGCCADEMSDYAFGTWAMTFFVSAPMALLDLILLWIV